mgnify:CR=1 FL=1
MDLPFIKLMRLYTCFIYEVQWKWIGGRKLEVYDDPIVYLGCILIADKQFYYGSLNNRIDDDLADKLKRIISESKWHLIIALTGIIMLPYNINDWFSLIY